MSAAGDWRDARIARERAARHAAEALLEAKSRELYEANQRIRDHAADLERLIAERTADLGRALDLAREAARSKDEFLAVLSHEMRTPVHGVLGMAELLGGTDLDEAQRRWLATLRGAGCTLLTLIDDLLDYAHMEADGVRLHVGPVDLRSLAGEVVESFRLRARERGLTLELAVAEDLPQRFAADAARVRQVLGNLIGNAIKFTRTGGVRVQLRARLGGAWADCAVSDTGIGIPAERLPRLFRLFSQADGSIRREFGGTGLGLAISRRLVEAMGGTIRAESTPGVGSTFSFSLPCLPVPGEADEPTAAPPLPAAGEAPPQVLLVEDNPVNQVLAEAMLGRLGIAPTLAADGEQAVALAARGEWDVILMDMQLPRMDGLEATRRIRAQGSARRPRIVAMSANAMERDRRACREAGMDDSLPKPFTLAELAACLGRRLPGG